MKRITATNLTNFVSMRDPSVKWMTEEKFIEELTGGFAGNEATEFGSLFHLALEKGIEKSLKEQETKNRKKREKGENIFHFEFSQPQREAIDYYHNNIAKYSVMEYKMLKRVFDDVYLSMVIDAILPNGHLHEFKTTAKFWNYGAYDKSPQKDIYLWATNRKRLDYYIFEVGKEKQDCRTIAPITYYSYKGIDEYVKELCLEFINYLKTNGI